MNLKIGFINTIYNILNGNIDAPDGKIDTSNWRWPSDMYGGGNTSRYRFCREKVDYGEDVTHRELYQGIEGPQDLFWLEIDLFNEALYRNDDLVIVEDYLRKIN